MAISKLTNKTYTNLPGHAYRSGGIDHIIIHHMAGNLSLDTCYNVLKGSGSSANYGIDSNGGIGCFLDEKYEPYTTSNRYIDDRAVTIEVANSGGAPGWPVSAKAFSSLVRLIADICKRNGIKSLNYTGDNRGNLEMHRWYAKTACPGDYLAGKFPQIAREVNTILGSSTTVVPPKPTTPNKKSNTQVAQEIVRGVGGWGNDPERTQKLTAAGYDAKAVQSIVNSLVYGNKPTAPAGKSNDTLAAEVIRGDWGNGADRQRRLTAAGYNYSAIQALVNKKLGY